MFSWLFTKRPDPLKHTQEVEKTRAYRKHIKAVRAGHKAALSRKDHANRAREILEQIRNSNQTDDLSLHILRNANDR